jgi:hypothetical protein
MAQEKLAFLTPNIIVLLLAFLGVCGWSGPRLSAGTITPAIISV